MGKKTLQANCDQINQWKGCKVYYGLKKTTWNKSKEQDLYGVIKGAEIVEKRIVIHFFIPASVSDDYEDLFFDSVNSLGKELRYLHDCHNNENDRRSQTFMNKNTLFKTKEGFISFQMIANKSTLYGDKALKNYICEDIFSSKIPEKSQNPPTKKRKIQSSNEEPPSKKPKLIDMIKKNSKPLSVPTLKQSENVQKEALLTNPKNSSVSKQSENVQKEVPLQTPTIQTLYVPSKPVIVSDNHFLYDSDENDEIGENNKTDKNDDNGSDKTDENVVHPPSKIRTPRMDGLERNSTPEPSSTFSNLVVENLFSSQNLCVEDVNQQVYMTQTHLQIKVAGQFFLVPQTTHLQASIENNEYESLDFVVFSYCKLCDLLGGSPWLDEYAPASREKVFLLEKLSQEYSLDNIRICKDGQQTWNHFASLMKNMLEFIPLSQFKEWKAWLNLQSNIPIISSTPENLPLFHCNAWKSFCCKK